MRTPPDEFDQLHRDLVSLFPKLRTFAEKFTSLLPETVEPLELVTEAVLSLLESPDAPRGDITQLKSWLKRKIWQGAYAHGRRNLRNNASLTRQVQLRFEHSQGADTPSDDRILSVTALPGCSTASHERAAYPEEQVLARERQKLSDDVMMHLLERAERPDTPLTYRVLEFYLEGEKRREIARNLNIDIKRVDAELQRIQRMLKGVLQDHPHLKGQWEELCHDQT